MGDNTITLGTHQEVHIGKFTADRQGLISGSVQRHVKEPFDQINWDNLRQRAAPPMGSLLCVNVERDYEKQNEQAIYTYTYEGAQDDFVPDDDLVTFELDLTMTEEPIETHPNFETLKTTYGWNPQKRQFAETAPNANSGSTGLSGGNSNKKPKKSPLYGVDSYLVIGGTFRKNYITRVIPSTIFKGIGVAVSAPPGLSKFPLPKAAKNRNWLRLAPRVQRRGNVVQISEQWMMSGPRGWVKDVYSASALGEDTPVDGLTTGSLTTGSL